MEREGERERERWGIETAVDQGRIEHNRTAYDGVPLLSRRTTQELSGDGGIDTSTRLLSPFARNNTPSPLCPATDGSPRLLSMKALMGRIRLFH